MRSNLALATLVLAVALPAQAYAVPSMDGADAWDSAAAPNPPTMESLHADIEACRSERCPAGGGLAPRDVERLAWWVSRGNRLAIRLSFAAADRIDGDGARALAQSYGNIIKRDPAAFLAMARDEGAPAAAVAADAAAVPDLLAGAQADELRARRDALQGVADPSLADLRDRCLAWIAGHLAALAPKLASNGA